MWAMSVLPVGKLRAEALQNLFDKYAPRDERVVVGPKVGEDAAVLDMGDRYLIATTDPITFATDEIGWYALQVNANDVAVRGARPRWFLATLLLPENATGDAEVERLFAQIGRACEELEVSLIGGHTEVTHGLDRVIVVGTMLGEVEKGKLVTTGGAKVGDALLLTKGLPIEGAAIIAREKSEALAGRGVPSSVIGRARGYLHRPGLSVVPEAMLAVGVVQVHAMHDPTEGGVATALWELAWASRVGLRVERERIAILPEGGRLCRELGLDPLGTISSGSLLIALAPSNAAALLGALEREGIACAVIGEVVPEEQGVCLVTGGVAAPMPVFPQDEITKIFREP